ncbi:endo-1,4-beta-xylanase [Alloacidobacterium dinghuense]|uniref:Endo-1,4-beta-xylanase n=1 Tax=Alloacidobacterium dinghuense TaxID=2763107 RepID=A0A7G8BKJ4_9BACT|nr:endo-1,4-beta-xylanase [Alloacidobacterium dinghuense]QNI33064.1 endo-1,4-beta-xylanase [Alloacidobacterium dinghuense]
MAGSWPVRAQAKFVHRLLFMLSAVALLNARSASPISDQTGNLPGQPIPSSYFSMNILFHPKNHVPWPSVPLGGWRTWHVNWADIQEQPNNFDFSLLDKYVNWSQEHHTEILMHLSYTPRWASSTPNAPTDVEVTKPPGLSGPPRNMEDWRTFVRTVATRYKGRIHNWELWNEPNRPQSWNGSVETMVQMSREAYTTLKQIDPTCTVVSPAAEEAKGVEFLDAFLSKGGGQYADVIGYHFYVGANAPPEAMVTLINSVKAVMAERGLSSKPLWDTEAGWLGNTMLPPETGAAWLARAYILNWAAGVSRFYWYAWEIQHGTQIELVGPDNATLKPAGVAFATIQKWMTGAVLTGCSGARDGLWTCAFQRENSVSHVMWSAAKETTVPVPPAWQAHEVEALNGNRTQIQSNPITVGIAPVLIQ